MSNDTYTFLEIWADMCRAYEAEAITAADAIGLGAPRLERLAAALDALGYPNATNSPARLGAALRGLRDKAAHGEGGRTLMLRMVGGGPGGRARWRVGAWREDARAAATLEGMGLRAEVEAMILEIVTGQKRDVRTPVERLVQRELVDPVAAAAGLPAPRFELAAGGPAAELPREDVVDAFLALLQPAERVAAEELLEAEGDAEGDLVRLVGRLLRKAAEKL